MNHAKQLLGKFLPQKKNTLLLVATLLLTMGVYFSFPYRGLLATLPIMFLTSFFVSLFYSNLWFCALSAGAIGGFYGMMAALPDPFLFGTVTLISSFSGAFCGKFLFRAFREKKIGRMLICFVLVIVGVVMPIFFFGTPQNYVQQKNEALSYLEKTYPDQTFSKITFFFDVREKGYWTTVEYPNGEGTLESELFFGEDEIKDGYYSDYSTNLLIQRKSELIRVFQKNEMNVVTQEVELIPTDDGVVRGVYGELSDVVIPRTHFSVTFREEKPERIQFAEACKEVLIALREEKVDFGTLTFYGLDAGNVVHRCIVTGETDLENILSLVTKNT